MEDKKWCAYCKEEIKEDERCIEVDGKYYHYDPNNYNYNNCYYPNDSEDEI